MLSTRLPSSGQMVRNTSQSLAQVRRGHQVQEGTEWDCDELETLVQSKTTACRPRPVRAVAAPQSGSAPIFCRAIASIAVALSSPTTVNPASAIEVSASRSVPQSSSRTRRPCALPRLLQVRSATSMCIPSGPAFPKVGPESAAVAFSESCHYPAPLRSFPRNRESSTLSLCESAGVRPVLPFLAREGAWGKVVTVARPQCAYTCRSTWAKKAP